MSTAKWSGVTCRTVWRVTLKLGAYAAPLQWGLKHLQPASGPVGLARVGGELGSLGHVPGGN